MVRQEGLVFRLLAPDLLQVQLSTVRGRSRAAAAQPDLLLQSKITAGLRFFQTLDCKLQWHGERSLCGMRCCGWLGMIPFWMSLPWR